MKQNKNISLGQKGEFLAEQYILEKGYKVIEKNYHSRFGELDLITSHKKTIIAIEVKTRSSLQYGFPEEAISYKKKDHIKKALFEFLTSNPQYKKFSVRIDVISIVYKENYPDIKQITHIE